MQKRLFLTPLAVIVFILYFTVFGDRGLLRINHLHRDRDEMQKRLLELKGENEKLRREIAALQSDRRYLESIARRDFGLVRTNEVIYQFPGHDKPALPQDPKAAGQKPPQPAEQKAGQPPEQHPAQPAVQKAAQPAAQKPAQQGAQKAVQPSGQKAVHPAGQKAAQQGAEKAGAVANKH